MFFKYVQFTVCPLYNRAIKKKAKNRRLSQQINVAKNRLPFFFLVCLNNKESLNTNASQDICDE